MEKIELLDNKAEIARIDQAGMLEVVASFPEMLSEAGRFSRGVALVKKKKISQIVISGMGGSAIAGDIAVDLLFDKSAVPILVNRGYQLSAAVNSETLFIALSYSGNTEETISALKEAEKRQAQIVCIASGGKIKEMAESKKYPFFLIPTGYQPRAALPFLLVPVLRSIEEAGIFSGLEEDLSEAIALLQKNREEYVVDKPLRYNAIKQLTKKLENKTPFVLAAARTTAAAGLRMKTQFNENSKITAGFNIFPELNHNEMVNLSCLNREEHAFCLLLLRDEADSERIKKRIEITKSLIGKQVGGINEIWSQGKSPLAKILSLVQFGDFLSVYLAIARGIDPTPVEVIERLKKEMAR
jgi:glucose/mannose-6-phosphate isomerase